MRRLTHLNVIQFKERGKLGRGVDEIIRAEIQL